MSLMDCALGPLEPEPNRRSSADRVSGSGSREEREKERERDAVLRQRRLDAIEQERRK